MSDTIERLAAEMSEWATGRRSHINEFMSLEEGSRQETLVNVALADAAEVDRLRAAIEAEIALERHRAALAAPSPSEPR
jgi:hypothetical protein